MKYYLLALFVFSGLAAYHYWPTAEEVDYDKVTHLARTEQTEQIDSTGTLVVICATGCASSPLSDILEGTNTSAIMLMEGRR